MSEELTLLPCPACGEEADIFDSFERDGKGHVAIGWSAYCTRGCLITSEHGSREKAATSWNALPRALEWTTEPPKVPGWYWFKDDLFCKKGGIMRITDVWIGEIKKTSGPHDQWAGPIPEPREPKE